MSENILERKTQRFMFDLNNFDDDHVEEEEFEEPPPPVFSEQELEAAKQSSYQEGFQKGRDEALKESAESREQFVAKELQVIAQNLPQIFEKENEREAKYEAESVRLNLYLFEKLFPYLHEIYGEESLKNSVSAILEKQSGQKKITIIVHPDAKTGIENHLETLSSRGLQMSFTVEADTNMAAGACQISWEDGGAIKNPQAMADEIFEFIKDALAGHETNGHDSVEERDQINDEPAPDDLPVNEQINQAAQEDELEKPDE